MFRSLILYMDQNNFFEKENCDRCGGDLKVRTLSWFNTDVICGNCSMWEEVIIDKCGENKSDLESIGHIPSVECNIRWGHTVPDKLK